MTDLAAQAARLRRELARRQDPDLADAVRDARARLDPAYRRELEAEHAYARREAPRDGMSNEMRRELRAQGLSTRTGGMAMEEKPRCEWCRRPISNEHADCKGCGHRQRLEAMYSTGGR